jgi:hypothetical protein
MAAVIHLLTRASRFFFLPVFGEGPFFSLPVFGEGPFFSLPVFGEGGAKRRVG